MKAKLLFVVNRDYDETINNVLKPMAVQEIWDPGLKKYIDTFPIDKMDEVIAIIGQPIELQGETDNVKALLTHMPDLEKEIWPEAYKGKGFVYVHKYPTLFIVKTVIGKKPKKFTIPLETVVALWRAIKAYPIDTIIKSKTLSGKFCEQMGVTRFNRETGSFDGDKLYGTRPFYFMYYYSLKVLENEGLIEYAKSGKVTVLKNTWAYQSVIL